MRRSAAPSQAGIAKRPRFAAPFITPSLQQPSCDNKKISREENVVENKTLPAADTSLPEDDLSNKSKSLESTSKVPNQVKSSVSSFRSPLTLHKDVNKGSNCDKIKDCTPRTVQPSTPDENGKHQRYLSVMWCKRSNKKHKKWEGDAVLITSGRSVTLIDMEGKEIGKGTGYKSTELEVLNEDETLMIGGKEIQVMSVLTEEQYKSGKCFSSYANTAQNMHKPTVNAATGGNASKPFMNPKMSNSKSNLTEQSKTTVTCTPRYNPDLPDAVVMPRPNMTHQWQYNKSSLPVVDVVLDPYLAVHLRPHQKEGVIFLYECVLGFREYGGQGAILADDMGLGKTLQCISLIWTLLKQGPYGGKPVIKRALIITPGSLVKNWSQEIKKWLGSERLNVYAVSTDKKVEDFVNTTIYPVLIISYEMFIRVFEKIEHLKFDLVICDEGHRLKNTAIKTTSIIMSLPTRKRVVLSGTPIQNDLQEFYSIVEFCNPGILGSSSSFKHIYEGPILAARQPGVPKEVVELGDERGTELSRLTKLFLLRRTQEINKKYLPPKCEIVAFCRPSKLQVDLYQALLNGRLFRSCLSGQFDGSPHLVCIGALKQLCNHPALIHSKAEQCDQDNNEDSVYQGLLPIYPDGFSPSENLDMHSGKLRVLGDLLRELHVKCPTEKIVLVSNHTQTLDLLQKFCDNNGYSYCRLDGQTPTNRRQEIVTQQILNSFSKAGGVGLNLIGASRLVLYDIDWNPATDLQAMARVWRDGQKKQVYIYRLLTTGTIEEKIYQRQVTKQALSGAVMDTKSKNEVQFSRDDLKDLFSGIANTSCDTHDLLLCDCQTVCETDTAAVQPSSAVRRCQLVNASYTAVMSTKSNLSMDELRDWKHLKGSDTPKYPEWFLKNTDEDVTFLFWNETRHDHCDMN